MDSQLQKFFHTQLWLECRFVLEAYDNLTRGLAEMEAKRLASQGEYTALSSLPREEMTARATEIAMGPAIAPWAAIQAFLTATANISKALWGQQGKYATERQDLRDTLQVAESSPLKPTSMRNNFDHFDERLDDWWDTSTSHNYVDLNFGDMGKAINGIPEDEMFRNLDVARMELTFWGKRYDLLAIVKEVERIMPLALRASIAS